MALEADEVTWTDRDRALYLPLLGRAKSPAAERFIDELFTEVVRPRMAGRQARPSSLDKARRALETLLGDLCRYRAQGRDGRHGMSQKDFPSVDLGFGRTAFSLVKEALVDAGLMQFRGGYKYASEGFDGGLVRHGGAVAFFRLAPILIDRLGALCGEDARNHWSHGRPRVHTNEPLLVLRPRKVAREQRKDLAFGFDEAGVSSILAEIEATNASLIGRVAGFAFAGVRRIYNDGDVPGKRWKRGGRYYSLPGAEAYEAMGKMARLEVVRLAEESVNEVDIKASHLTILHAVFGLPFEPGHGDPYGWGDVDREATKAFVTTSVGKGTVHWSRWSFTARDAYAAKRPGRKLEADYTVAEVRSAVLQRYPFLQRLAEEGLNSLDVSWHEAEILTHAMASLRNQGVPSLPVHDSLMVPSSKLDETRAALRRGFAMHFGSDLVIPALHVTYGGPNAEALNI